MSLRRASIACIGILAMGVLVLRAGLPPAGAQDANQTAQPQTTDAKAPATAAADTGQASQSKPADTKSTPLSKAQLDQLVAPIALYPDDLVSQILMASTYPLEVVEAARWVKDNPGVKGKALEDAMAKQNWDPSVKALAALPEVLAMMSEKLSWTQQLGDAFLAQQADVLAAVQDLRAKADAEGNLKTTKQQTVEKKTVATSSGGKQQVIVIQPTNPDVIYVPAYDPLVIYGAWPYPAYRPYYWYPPGYVASSALWFGAGVATGYAIWGRCNWGYGRVTVNVNAYNSFNRANINSTSWQHNSVHRRGVSYNNSTLAARYGKGGRNAQAVQARNQFRGRAETGRKQLAARPPGELKGPGGDKRPGANKRPGADNRPGASKRPSDAKRPAANRPKQGANRQTAKQPSKSTKRPSQAKRPSAYKGVGNGKQTRKHSARGKQSRKVARSGGHRRGGGGGRRGGGRRR